MLLKWMTFSLNEPEKKEATLNSWYHFNLECKQFKLGHCVHDKLLII